MILVLQRQWKNIGVAPLQRSLSLDGRAEGHPDGGLIVAQQVVFDACPSLRAVRVLFRTKVTFDPGAERPSATP